MNFGIAALIVMAVWAVVSILVSVTIGNLADYRDSEQFRVAPKVEPDLSDEHDRIAS